MELIMGNSPDFDYIGWQLKEKAEELWADYEDLIHRYGMKPTDARNAYNRDMDRVYKMLAPMQLRVNQPTMAIRPSPSEHMARTLRTLQMKAGEGNERHP